MIFLKSIVKKATQRIKTESKAKKATRSTRKTTAKKAENPKSKVTDQELEEILSSALARIVVVGTGFIGMKMVVFSTFF